MEIWVGGNNGWIKKPFKSFSASEPLFPILREHQKEDLKTEHWLVLSVEEEEEIRKAAASIYPPSMVPIHFLEAICGSLRGIFSNPPYVTYVSNHWIEPPDCKNRPRPRLAIRFNHDFSGR